jgi:hypothetical protein
VTLPLPVPLAVTSGWEVVDWLDRAYPSDPADANGNATVQLSPLADNERWQLSHAVIRCTSTTVTQLRLYLDSISDNGLRDGSDKGNFDVADWAMGLWVPPGRALLARWTGCSAGAVATITLQATILRRRAG